MILRTIRAAWGWPDSEIEKLKHDRLIEIYDEAKYELEKQKNQMAALRSMFGMK